MRARALVSIAATVAVATGVVVAPAGGAAAPSCRSRTLVLSAMPVELRPLLAQEKVQRVVTVDGRDYVVGRLRGHDVVLALTGIGPVNARQRTRAALAAFRCGSRPGIDAVVFSGVAGGDFIGDVIVPTRWTSDAGKHVYGVSRRLLAAARRVARAHVALERTAGAGDPACACVTDSDLVAPVTVTHPPRVEVGGAGQTTDPFSGRALPCAPAGGDVFGCAPCVLQEHVVGDATRFAPGVLPFADPAFFTGYFSATATESSRYVVEDEETAVVDAVAAAAHLPFLGIRAVSDGGGDPLHLPGFPVQFFVYRQLAADNAARVTLAVLSATSLRS